MSEIEKLLKRALAKFSHRRAVAKSKGETHRFKKLDKLMTKIEAAPLGLTPGSVAGGYFVIGAEDRRIPDLAYLPVGRAILPKGNKSPATASLPDAAVLAQLEQLLKDKPRRPTPRKTSSKGN